MVYNELMDKFLAIFSIVFGVMSLPLIWALATDRLNWGAKRDKKLYKEQGRKIANKWNAVFMTMMAVTAIVFGAVLLMKKYELLMYIVPVLAVEALGPIGVLFYVNAKWKKK